LRFSVLRACSLVLLGVHGICSGFGLASLLLKTDFVPRRCQALTLSTFLGALGGSRLGRALAIHFSLLALRLGVSLKLRRAAISLDLFLALLCRDFVLQALALEFGLGPFLLEIRLSLALPRLGCVPGGFDFGFGLSLLKPSFPGEIVVAYQGPCGFLGFASDLANQAAAGSLRVRLVSQSSCLLRGVVLVRDARLPCGPGVRAADGALLALWL
jgi:hypothetical protein